MQLKLLYGTHPTVSQFLLHTLTAQIMRNKYRTEGDTALTLRHVVSHGTYIALASDNRPSHNKINGVRMNIRYVKRYKWTGMYARRTKPQSLNKRDEGVTRDFTCT